MVKYQFTSQDCENENTSTLLNKIKEDYEAQQAYITKIEAENAQLKEQVKYLLNENKNLKQVNEPGKGFLQESKAPPSRLFQSQQQQNNVPLSLFDGLEKKEKVFNSSQGLFSNQQYISKIKDQKEEENREQEKSNQEEENLQLFGDPSFNDGEKIVQLCNEQIEQASSNFQDLSLNSENHSQVSNDEDSETQHINE